jgi:hypothetical protein
MRLYLLTYEVPSVHAYGSQRALCIFRNPYASRVLQGLISRMHTNGPGCIRDTYAAPPSFCTATTVQYQSYRSRQDPARHAPPSRA